MQEIGNFMQDNLKGAVSELTKRFLHDDDCHKGQVDYLKETCMPKDWKFLSQVTTMAQATK